MAADSSRRLVGPPKYSRDITTVRLRRRTSRWVVRSANIGMGWEAMASIVARREPFDSERATYLTHQLRKGGSCE
ncbi:hypothetical protein AGMMS50218_08940 [Actinomycetota bacterium]|nr:hypothetical protein AGMMS50218_08940 [Actinomycetota bacterium]